MCPPPLLPPPSLSSSPPPPPPSCCVVRRRCHHRHHRHRRQRQPPQDIAVSKIEGEGKYREDCLHRRPGVVAGYSEETLKKITKTHFGMTEVHAATARGHFSQRLTAPAACKLVASESVPWSMQVFFMSTEVFVLLYSLERFGAQYQIFVGPLATRRECHTSLKRRV